MYINKKLFNVIMNVIGVQGGSAQLSPAHV